MLNDANALKNWDILGAHFYASEASTGDNFFQYSLADQKNVERWMTEHYTESQGSGNYWRTVMRTGDQANQNKLDTVRAMDVAYEMFRGLAIGNFNQYTWWYIRRCYGLIMEKDFGNKLSIPQNEIGKVSKRGYIMSQYARFIRPGAIRVGATQKPEANLFASAYKSSEGDSVIVVLVNRDYKNTKSVTVNVKGADVESFHVYTTSEAKNAKYEGEVEAKNGSVTITMDPGNTSNKDCIVTLVGVGTPAEPVPREPFGGKAVELPGKIEAENFDVPGTGKENKTYYDSDSENHACTDEDKTAECSKVREDTGVDIYKKSSGAVVVGHNQAGEWLEYTVNVKEAGEYTMTASVATANSDPGFTLSIDGKSLAEVPVSGSSWDEFKDVTAKVTLPAGEHILRLEVTTSWFDIDYLKFEKPCDDCNTTIAGASLSLPTEAENYRIFDINGSYLGMVKASSMPELRTNAANLVKRGGAYLAKSMNGRTKLIQVTK